MNLLSQCIVYVQRGNCLEMFFFYFLFYLLVWLLPLPVVALALVLVVVVPSMAILEPPNAGRVCIIEQLSSNHCAWPSHDAMHIKT